MPRQAGPRVAVALTRLRPGQRVLHMSGYADDTIVHHGVLDPGTDLPAKPFPTGALLRKVREVLDRPEAGS